MLKKERKYTYRTRYELLKLFITLLFCIFLQINFAQSIDSTTIDEQTTPKLSSFIEKVKVPILKQGKHKSIWILPAITWNNYDKTQLGILWGVDLKNTSFLAATQYGTGSKNLSGFFRGHHTFQWNQHQFSIHSAGRKYTYLLFPEDLSYHKLQPGLQYQFQKTKELSFTLRYTNHLIWTEYLLAGRQTAFYYANDFRFSMNKETENYQSQSIFRLLQLKKAIQTHLVQDFNFYLSKEDKTQQFDIKLSAVYQFNTNHASIEVAPVLRLSGATNQGIYWLQKDFLFEEWYLDRNGIDPFFSKQIANSDGGFYAMTNLGNVNQFLLSINAKSDIFIAERIARFVNINPYLNIAYAGSRQQKAALYAESGISLLFFRETLQFHVPFVLTNNIKNNQAQIFGIQKGEWVQRISFSIELNKLKNLIRKK